ncbi:MAG: hypothetical protein EOO20_03050 [Chryseobacterium sp.]|nr:hypothetical protein [Agrobacterium tumefaciens]NTE26892.1 hypothetical protein [Agrobacterium tumefaciens]RZJ92088.1 MAG: hypothetical protein EOO20_03050 [Chryseobacterium sp.]
MFQDLNNLSTWISLGTFMINAISDFFIVQAFMLQAKIMLDQQEQLSMQRKLSEIEHERYRVQFRPITIKGYLKDLRGNPDSRINRSTLYENKRWINTFKR